MKYFIFVIVQFLPASYSKLRISEEEWEEMNKHRTVDKILDQADLIESVTEVSDWCLWIKVEYKEYKSILIIHYFLI